MNTLYTYKIPPAVSFEGFTLPPKELLMQLLKEWTTHSFTEADVFCGAIFSLHVNRLQLLGNLQDEMCYIE